MKESTKVIGCIRKKIEMEFGERLKKKEKRAIKG